jgi:hypothetical protein
MNEIVINDNDLKVMDNIKKVANLSEFDLEELQSYFASEGWLYNQDVVGIREFIESEHYLDAKGIVYPVVMECLEELNDGDYDEALLTGSIGCAKSTIALYTTAYLVYLLSAMKSPQAAFGLDPSSEIVIIFQSINEKIAKAVEFLRFKAMIDGSPYFRKHFRYDKNYESELRFPHRIIVKPVSGSDTAAIGQNVIGGIIDEINFMANVDKSKKSVDGGNYDQALSIYNSISRRRKSRFMNQGRLPGVLCLVSSKRYPGQFTDKKEAEARRELLETGHTSIYVYDKRSWDIRPETFCGEVFSLFVGDEVRRPRILDADETVAPNDRHLVTEVPIEYLREFERDMMNAMRDIAGIATLSLHPFLMNIEAVAKCIGTHDSILSNTMTDFTDYKVSIQHHKIVAHEFPRFVHIDLAVTGDSAGVVMGFVPGFKKVKRAEDQEEVLPIIQMDFTLEVRPPKNGEITFSNIRELIYQLRDCGINIKWVSFDTYQSTDSIQIMRQKGFNSGTCSMDRTPVPYEFTKAAFYDGRLRIPEHDKLFQELKGLERNVTTSKIDHPSKGSKDISDSLAGVVYGITRQRLVWALHGISLLQLPPSITVKPEKDRE